MTIWGAFFSGGVGTLIGTHRPRQLEDTGQKLGRGAAVSEEICNNKETETPSGKHRLHCKVCDISVDLQRAILTSNAGNPLPRVIHAELSAALLSAGRLIIVGDVHGCADEMQTLLRKCQYKQGSDVLIFNGDIINKGPKSVQVCRTHMRDRTKQRMRSSDPSHQGNCECHHGYHFLFFAGY